MKFSHSENVDIELPRMKFLNYVWRLGLIMVDKG